MKIKTLIIIISIIMIMSLVIYLYWSNLINIIQQTGLADSAMDSSSRASPVVQIINTAGN